MPQDSSDFHGLAFPPLLIAPLPKRLPGGTTCSGCDRPQANWFLQAAQGLAPICSLCVLYEVPWQGKDEADVARYIEAVEAARSKGFPKDPKGRLLRCADADRLVASLVMTSKVMLYAKGRK